MKSLIITLVSLSAALLPATAEASITITSNSTAAYGNDGVGSPFVQYFSGTGIPTSTMLDGIDGTTYSKNTIDWTTAGGQTILSFDMVHQREGTQDAYAVTYDASLYFTSNASTTYELSGYYNVTDFGANDSGRVFQVVELYDRTAGIFLFRNRQESQTTNDEQFTLGAMGGDFGNLVVGSLTGNLIAGRDYALYFNNTIHAYPDADSGASAVGNLTLTIGESTAAPEPFSLLVWLGVMACGAGGRAWRRG